MKKVKIDAVYGQDELGEYMTVGGLKIHTEIPLQIESFNKKPLHFKENPVSSSMHQLLLLKTDDLKNMSAENIFDIFFRAKNALDEEKMEKQLEKTLQEILIYVNSVIYFVGKMNRDVQKGNIDESQYEQSLNFFKLTLSDSVRESLTKFNAKKDEVQK